MVVVVVVMIVAVLVEEQSWLLEKNGVGGGVWSCHGVGGGEWSCHDVEGIVWSCYGVGGVLFVVIVVFSLNLQSFFPDYSEPNLNLMDQTDC